MSKKIKQEEFIIGLPRWLFESEYLSNNEKIFMLVLRNHYNSQTELCFPSIRRISKEAMISKPTIFKIRKKLKEVGLIDYRSERGRKHSTHYELLWLNADNKVIATIERDLKQKQIVKLTTYLNSKVKLPLNSKIALPLNSKVEIPRTKKNCNKKKYNKNNNNKVAVADNFSLSEETIKTLKSYGLSDSKIRELINLCPDSDKTKYFSNWLAFIERNPKDNPGGFLIRMVEKKQNSPVNHSELKKWYEEKIGKLIQKAIEDLEKLASVDRIVEWLRKIPDSDHSQFERIYKQKYPKNKFFVEAEVKYYQSKKENQDQRNKPLETDEEVARRLKIMKREKYTEEGEIR